MPRGHAAALGAGRAALGTRLCPPQLSSTRTLLRLPQRHDTKPGSRGVAGLQFSAALGLVLAFSHLPARFRPRSSQGRALGKGKGRLGSASL